MTDINFIKKLSSIDSSVKYIPKTKDSENINSAFKDLFKEKLKDKAENEVVFSKHASERIKERNMDVDSSVTDKLNQASEQARDKGLKSVLVMIDNQAFIISTQNNKVVTALNSNDLKENIFTNIDGAVIK